MWKFPAIFLLLISWLSCADARPRGAPSASAPAVTTCDITTGACTGQGAGAGLFTAATCNGVADDAAAFNSFNAWAQASTTNVNGQLLELFVPSGKSCRWTSGNVNVNLVMTGIKNGRVSAYGATFQNPTGNGFRLGASPQPGGMCQKGLDDAAGCSARVNSVSAGATSVTINTTGYSGSLSTLCSRFVTGEWAVVTGFDLQSSFGSVFGEPPNPHFLDFVQIGSTAACAGTGVIQIGPALRYSYLSTWPLFSAGSAVGSDKGGPATIYALTAGWGGAVEVRGLTIDSPNDQTIAQGRSVTFRDITMTGAHCIIPSQNATFTMVNASGTGCTIEIDKVIGDIVYDTVSFNRIRFQSSSTNSLTLNNATLTNDLDGTPKVTTINNLTTGTLRLGPRSYGVATSATCTNCVVTNAPADSGITENGQGAGAINFFTVSSGVFSYPSTTNVTGMANNGSGLIRITVPSTTGWKTGATVSLDNAFSSCTGPCPVGNNGITVIDGTHIDFNSTVFANVTWSGGGTINNAVPRWAVPGANFFTTGQWAASSGAYQVTATTLSGGFVNVATTVPGGFPTVPLSGGNANLLMQMPKWTCTNCSGSADMVDFSSAPPNIPIFSYSNRTFNNSTPLASWNLWGKVASIKINVTTAYTGATNPLRVNLPEETVIPAGTTTFWNPLIDLRTAGLRTITPAGVTCDTGGGPIAGGCGSDSALTLPDPAAMFAGTLEQQMPNGTPVDQPWSMTAEFIMDQGVVP